MRVRRLYLLACLHEGCGWTAEADTEADAMRRAQMHFGNFNSGGRENVVHRVEQRTVIEVHPDELA